jgi:ribosome assembly protein 1
LFDVPSSQVVRTSSKHGPLSKLTGAAGTDAAAGAKHHTDFSSSSGSSSMANGSVAAAAHEASQVAAEAAGAAAADHAAQQLQQIHVPFGWPSAAALLSAGASATLSTHSREDSPSSSAAAAAAAAAAGVSDLWPHITGSVESGVTAGFQLAAAAGPLCDEPLWGVVFEVEVVLVVPPAAAAAAAAAGGQALDLAEGVYGPFSGQVRVFGGGAGGGGPEGCLVSTGHVFLCWVRQHKPCASQS